ncbi:MAG: hypothetical protein HY301_07440 [Verrucomicrobia bacterium]|nr:hypothetical protein [Verrucomicrobiota bacterium]
MFIVTEGRENIKMGLVTIRVFKEADALLMVKAQKAAVDTALSSLRTKISQAKDDTVRSGKLFTDADTKEAEGKTKDHLGYALLDSEHVAQILGLDNQQIKHQLLIRQKTEKASEPQGKTDKVEVAHDLFIEAYALTNSAFKLRSEAQDLVPAVKATMEEASRWPQTCAVIYFAGLPEPVSTAKTDADGKFSLKLPAKTRFAIAAEAERTTPAGRESYNWLVWVSVDDDKGKSIMLSNDNLFAANSSESVVMVERP